MSIPNPVDYIDILEQLKLEIRTARLRATLAINNELLQLYWRVGTIILKQQQSQGWGAKVIQTLSEDVRKEFPDLQGFSPRNLLYMRQFASIYPDGEFTQLPVAQLPWAHQVILLDKVKETPERQFYIQKTIENGWSRDVLSLQIKSKLFQRQGGSLTNFEQKLPAPQSDLAHQLLKDPYIFDFLTLTEDYQEKDLESALTQHITTFLLELGAGFAFVGRQYHLEVGGQDFYLNLLFYHLKLRSYVVIELKKVNFCRNMRVSLTFTYR